ncbi:MAG: threonine--tRNA ligase [Parcubacteria group bacterium]|nr:MAG: threonine--tRNA ligase [Parcubacteria group bacterium]
MNNSKLDHIRHSLSHILAMAVLKKFPDAKLGIGPTIDNGFYYDFLLPDKLSEEDLPELEKSMRQIIGQKIDFKKSVLSRAEALKKVSANKQNFKEELINDLPENEEISFYESDDFTDLCAGPHVENSSEINTESFKLTHLAGAYWRGDDTRDMLTRIYGVAFNNKNELAEHLKMLEEAKLRDHRKLGKELDLFTFSDMIGGGLPVWLPHGTVLRDELEKLAKETEFQCGYERVSTPVISKEALFLKSGHLPHYKESMYAPMDIDGEDYYIKPMNCPFHHVVFQSKMRSYRELPLRLAEYGLCHRYEKSGELQGLMRVRSMCMNDAHIYVRPDQVKEEIKQVIQMHQYYYNLFGIDKVSFRLSKHDPADLGGKYVNMPQEWADNEQILREVLTEMKVDFFEAENEASFYGPKIDVQIFSAIGKEYTIGTVQLDFAQPQKFELKYTDETGKEVMPYCIHRAPLSVHERFIAFLIEHFGANFPLWLSPVQVRINSVADKHSEFCQNLGQELKKHFIRVQVDLSAETVGNKIRKSAKEKIPYTLVIGDKEMASDKLAVRVRGQEKLWEVSKDDFIRNISENIKQRKLEL